MRARTKRDDRRKGGLNKKGYYAAKDLKSKFAMVYAELSRRGQRVSRVQLARVTFERLPADDPRRKRCTESAARRWLKEFADGK